MTNRFPWLHGFLAALPGAESDFKAEWGWTRYKVGGRMFAAVCQNERGEDFLLTLKADPVEAQLQRASFWRVFPGYYCTKHCWNSVYLCDPARTGRKSLPAFATPPQARKASCPRRFCATCAVRPTR